MFKYKEYEYAKTIRENGFQTNNTFYEGKLLALFLRDEYNMKPQERKMYLIDFFKRYDFHFVYERDFAKINKIVNYSKNKNNKLLQIDKIEIPWHEIAYIEELCKIHQLNSIYFKRTLLTFLVYTKLCRLSHKFKFGNESLKKHFSGGSRKYKNMKSMCGVPVSCNFNKEVISPLVSCGLIETFNYGTISFKFIDDIPLEKFAPVVLAIDNFSNIGMNYDLARGNENVISCKHCHSLFLRKRVDQTLCQNCRKKYFKIYYMEKKFKESLSQD